MPGPTIPGGFTQFIITPPAADAPSVYWDRMLGAAFQNETETDGLPLSATYQNSTIRLVRHHEKGTRAPPARFFHLS